MKSFAILFIAISSFVYADSICIAHRGFHKKHLENSTAALLAGIDAQIGGVEFDLNHTKEGIAILHHDPTLKRLAINKPGKNCIIDIPIKELSLADIQQNCELRGHYPIETFKQFVDFLKNRNELNRDNFLFIDLKDEVSNLSLHEFEELLSFYPNDRVVFISYHQKQLLQIKNHLEMRGLYLTKALLLQNFISPKIIQGIDGVDFQYLDWKPFGFYATIRKIINNNLLTSVWTINSSAKIKDQIKRGVHFITTNEPLVCKQIVSKQGHEQ